MSDRKLLSDLARVKALFQARAIATAMGIDPNTVKMEPQATPNNTMVDFSAP